MRFAACLLVALTMEPTAQAGPWVQLPRQAYLRAGLFDGRVEGIEAKRYDLYSELGLNKNWTLSAKAEQVIYPKSTLFNETGYRLTARREIFNTKGFVGALEVGAVQGAAVGSSFGCSALGSEIRAGLGWSGKWRKSESFAFAEVGTRSQGSCETQLYEAALGQKVFSRLWSVSDVWVTQRQDAVSSQKIQTTLLWRGKMMDYNLGYRQEVSRQFTENGVFIGLAKRF